MSEPVVRMVEEEDLAEIQAIYAPEVRTGTVSFEIRAPDVAEMGARWRKLDEAGYPYLLAALEGRVMGFAFAGPYHRRAGYRHTLESSVYVAAGARRRGVGQALLTRLIEECERLGFRQMVGIVGDSANVASLRLHERCGFRTVGTLENVGFKLGRWLDVVIMQRTLGAGAGTPPLLFDP